MSTYARDLASAAPASELFAPAAKTSTGNGTGVDMSNGFGRCCATLHVGTTTGTTPTLDVKIQESVDNSTWTDVSGAVFATATAAQTPVDITFDRTKQYLRAVATLGGTSPSFTMAVVVREQLVIVQ